MEEVTYRSGSRREATEFADRWIGNAARRPGVYPASIEHSSWASADQFVVAEAAGNVVGVAAFREGPRAELFLVAVEGEFGNRGIGGRLTNDVLDRLVSAGRTPIFCEIACTRGYMESIIRKSPFAGHVRAS
jgi:ribosomal protein S18 acetylase RimI-like enzyme